jgi:RNA polymerase sigma-70 factor (ECF subfamily)
LSRDIRPLIEREAPGLLNYFGRRVDRDDAADLLSETLLVAWRRARAIPDDDERARMWLYGVARKVLATHRRSAVRRSSLADRLRLELAAQPPVTAERPDVTDLIAALDELDREIIGLVYWEGFGLAEVAQILGMPAATVRSRHARARAKLKALLLDVSPQR